jgi:S1-C subfamily serine protease
MIRCPKCSHEQENEVECEVCGLIFRKYEEARERRKVPAQAPACGKAERKGSLPRIASVIFLVALTSALTYYFAVGRNKPQAVDVKNPSVSVLSVEEGEAVPEERKVEQAEIAGTPIENARNGTVSIETPWGNGSGFFIADSKIVTNKHVVAPDRSQTDEIRHKVETQRRLISLEQEKLAELRRQVNQMEDGPSRRQLIIILQEREKELAKVIPVQEDAENRLKLLENQGSASDIKIILVDGNVLSAQSVQTSPSRDLALLTVCSSNMPVLKAASKNSVLRQGDRVYTIGSPVGLRHTVTSGIFSGYRQNETTREIMLQTDAPINPGNSGGPLIDERGMVHGVNTMIIRGTQGIGFAIPIRSVLDEFSISQP